MKQTEAETKRVAVDFAHLAELEKMECVTRIITEPRLEVRVRSELTPEFTTIGRFGDTVEQETRRRLPWVEPDIKPEAYGRVFAGEKGGSDDTH